VGLWLIGACGGIGSTVALGLEALRRRLTTPQGLVSALPEFAGLPLVAPEAIVLGGHEVRSEDLVQAVWSWRRDAGLFDPDMIRRCEPGLRAVQRNIRPGTLLGSSPAIRAFADRGDHPADKSAAAAVERLSADIVAFQRRHKLDTVVVINVSSSEAAVRPARAHERWSLLQRALTRRAGAAVPGSSLYALAAIEAGCPYINFTPSTGIALPALCERAAERGVPYMGRDGKTGETLVKSVLAPMFATRNLRVLSWFGQNILGNRDGAVLDDPVTRQSKIDSKDAVLGQILGYKPASRVNIDYVPSLSDWKVAWDFVHFEGFLGTKMSMQFVWQGCDSILAAPLVIDLARFAAFEEPWRRGGPMRHLACFFKSPMHVSTADLASQWTMLVEHVTSRAANCGIPV
jgi:myo-inositol-1-phosphate synthase